MSVKIYLDSEEVGTYTPSTDALQSIMSIFPAILNLVVVFVVIFLLVSFLKDLVG